MVEILIWNEDMGFYKINEGNGQNLDSDDVDNGYVDYIMFSHFEYNGEFFNEVNEEQIMLTEEFKEQFHSVTDVINYLIWKTGWLPTAEYTVLYTNEKEW